MNRAQPGDNFNGTGQGSGASPAIWTAVCIVLLKLLQRKGTASAFTSAISAMPTIVAALCYVDDTDLLQRAQSNTETITHTIQSLQSNVDIWAQGLMATGGALKPEKCWWSLIDFKPTPQGWQYITSHNTPGLKMEVPTEKGIRTPIQRLDCTEGIRSLGV